MSAQDLLDLAQNRGTYDEQLAAIDERLRPYAREGVALHEGAGRSVFGGDGPKFEGAESFWFIAAVDLADVPHLDPLPADGHLRFYWDPEFAEYERMDFVVASRVAYEPGPAPEVLGGIPLSGLRMPIVGAIDDGLDEDAYDALDEIMGAYKHQLLGNSRDIQGPVLDGLAYWFDEAFPETRERYSEADLRERRFDRVMGIMQCS